MEAAVAGRLVWCCTHCGAIYRSDFPRCPNDGAEVLASKRDPLVGTTLEHYAIEALIGEGAMGRVYRASHSHLSAKHYAVKVLIGDLAVTASNRLRFAKEAESASKLSHPNVVGVIDFGRTQKGLLYIAMELVDGEAASKIVDRGPMEPARLIRLARGVCEGLAHAHAAGIVHRDLKPDNILVVQEPGGELGRIVDFGLAISTDPDDARLTTTGMTMGTPAYVAPEQASGRPIDHRVDLYALGVSMFEMVTGGKLPFEAADPVTMITAKVTREAPPLDQVARRLGVPRGLSQVIAKLLRRKPEERYASATDVIAALDRVDLDPARARRYHHAAAAVAVAAMLGAGAWAAIAPAATPGGAAATSAIDVGASTPSAAPTPSVVARPSKGATAPLPIDNGAAAGTAQQPTIDTARSPAQPQIDDVARAGSRASTDRGTSSAHGSATRSTQRPPPARHAPTHPAKSRVAAAPPPDEPPEPVAIAPALEASAPPPPPPPPPPPTRVAQVAGVDVSGPLSQADVRRAVERASAALRACTIAGDPKTLDVRFTIGENRRAENLYAVGGGSAASRCVIGALAGLRTETAPDVGEATVSVKVSFQ